MNCQTPADFRRMGDELAAQSYAQHHAGLADRAIATARNALILFGAADVIERRRAGLPSFPEGRS